VRSLLVVPAVASTYPGGHSVHAVHDGAFSAVLKPPLVQAAQVRSAVALPSAVTWCPGVQSVRGAHVVAGSAS